ncbi:MAG: UDP-N-acetylmuramoyl-L-alanine--D-glutamate ligase [Oscillospiraceae bacterium]|nr:UDP-N-acetylmuramoyl-L-alanine--D-glutamate ligase [Oscillospiraceae bacterium]
MTLSEYISTVKDKRITVIGIGVSNIPLIKKLAENGCSVTACDRRAKSDIAVSQELENMGVKLSLGERYLDGIEADIIFRTPGIRHDLPQIAKAVSGGAELTSEMEVFFKVCPCEIIGITGSDGKTTTTTLISELLKAEGKTVHIGGNIGTPLLCSADDMDKDDIAVVELSSFQLMTMKQGSNTAVVTNLSPNHLDVHRDMEEYVEAKRNICSGNSLTVLNLDNEITAGFAGISSGKIRYFSMKQPVENGVFCEDEKIYAVRSGVKKYVLDTADIRIPGRHNIENYMAAYAAVMDHVSAETLKKVAREFGGVAHRIEFVRELDGVKYYNDSIASSPSRTIAGLKSFDKKLVLIAGGKDKGVPFDELGREIVKRVKKLVVTGYTKEKIHDAVVNAPEYNGKPEIHVIEDFKEAVLRARAIAEEGDIVILSPACTSFDKFKNFEERGNTFKKIVLEME